MGGDTQRMGIEGSRFSPLPTACIIDFCQLHRRSRRRFLFLAALRGIRRGAERRERYRFCQLHRRSRRQFLYLAGIQGIRRGAEESEAMPN